MTAKIIKGAFPVGGTTPSNDFQRAGGSSENTSQYSADAAPIQAANVAHLLRWSADQDRALLEIKAWLKSSVSAAPLFKLWGCAGTGKSTLLAFLARDIPGAVVLTPTNKAAAVQRAKGIEAQTIHSYCYNFEGTEVECLRQKISMLAQTPARNRDELDRLKAQLQKLIDEATRRGLRPTGAQYFYERAPGELPSLLIIDEASMVCEEHAARILSFGVKVLAIGDPFQLPPVGDRTAPFVSGSPDAMLNMIHRQAAGSPIIHASQQIREYGLCSFRSEENENGAINVIYGEAPDEALLVEQIIVGRHITRVPLNRRARALRGFSGETPMIGERLVNKKNSFDDRRLCNGEILTVQESLGVEVESFGERRWKGRAQRDGSGEVIAVRADLEMLAISAGAEGTADSSANGCDDLHYGYAITCHAAQGSQWDDVLVVDESPCFREHRARWLYTAITRAVRNLTIIIGGGRGRTGLRR